MEQAAAGACGVSTVRDGEGILHFGTWLQIAGEEPWEEGVGISRKGVDGERRSALVCEAKRAGPKKGGG